MTIRELTEVLKRCADAESLDELIRLASEDPATMEGDSVKLKFVFDNESKSEVHIELERDDISIDEMTLEQLEEYLDDLEDEYDDLENEEPDNIESDEHAEWVQKLDALDDKKFEVQARIDYLRAYED